MSKITLKALQVHFKQGIFIGAIFSNVRKKSLLTYTKLSIKPIEIKDVALLQLTYYYNTKIVHENRTSFEAMAILEKLLNGYFKQGILRTVDTEYHLLINKKGEITKLHSKM